MRKKVVATALSLTLVFGIAIGVSAAPVLEKVSAHLHHTMNFVLDGQEWTPTGQDGRDLTPIVYEETTYLPVRAVGEAVGIAVDWDQETQSVILGERTGEFPITSEELDLNYSSFATVDKAYTVQNGVDYQSGIVLEQLNSASKDFDLVSNNKYQTLDLSIFALDKDEDYRVQISNESGVVLKDITLSPEQTSREFQVDIGGMKEITISAKSSLGGSSSLFITGSYQ
ncbi:stalk domain-containing protein [Oceanobacillus senegalensis]|uniref:stalk domain-containing protein n=1 Tax=Oceanobacillus senegalensis TaxID=1936063 RepID=UPI0015C476BD|nr:stalk domain-containing protein [Oceanobacillus senegalensis]